MLEEFQDEEDMMDDYDLYDTDLRDLKEEIINGFLVFDPRGNGFLRYKSIPVIFELLELFLREGVPTKLTFRNFLWQKEGALDFLRQLLDADPDPSRKARNLTLIAQLMANGKRKTYIPISEVSEFIAAIAFQLRRITEKYEKDHQEWRNAVENFDPFRSSGVLDKVLKGEKLASDDEFSSFYKAARLFDIELVHQDEAFLPGLRKAFNSYLEDIIQARIIFDGVLPWEKQLGIVRSELEYASAGRNEMFIDHQNFARKLSYVYDGIPSNLKPVECLFILEKLEEIVIQSIRKDEDDRDRGECIQFRIAYRISTVSKPTTDEQHSSILQINGLTIDFEKQKVSHPEYGSHIFRTGKTPWTIIRICAEGKIDGEGKASLETLGITRSDIHKKLELVNKHFSQAIAYYKDEVVFLDPDFRK